MGGFPGRPGWYSTFPSSAATGKEPNLNARRSPSVHRVVVCGRGRLRAGRARPLRVCATARPGAAADGVHRHPRHRRLLHRKRRHPFIDKPAGASIANWIKTLEAVVADHQKDTIYIYGHAGPKFEATGGSADLLYMRDYLTALLEFVKGEMKAGKPRDVIVKITDPLKGFPDHGPLVERVFSAAYEELAG
jgi:hypothetical protein